MIAPRCERCGEVMLEADGYDEPRLEVNWTREPLSHSHRMVCEKCAAAFDEAIAGWLKG